MAFWHNRSISLMDMYMNDGEPSEKCGDLNFGLEYDFATQTLKLKIIQVPHKRDLNKCSLPQQNLQIFLIKSPALLGSEPVKKEWM